MDKLLKYSIGPVLLAPVIYLFIVWNSLPDTVVVHFKAGGTQDNLGSKTELITGVLILLAVNIVIYFLVKNIYKIDRQKNAVANKDRLNRMAFASSVYVSAIIIMTIFYSASVGSRPFDVRFIFGTIGFMWSIFGNYIYTMKPNSFAGIRNRWILNNKENWRKTHLLAGKLWFITGLLLTTICLLAPQSIAVIAFIIVSFSIGFIPIIYSYYIHKVKRNNHE